MLVEGWRRGVVAVGGEGTLPMHAIREAMVVVGSKVGLTCGTVHDTLAFCSVQPAP